jgi:putative membrane protein
MNRLSLTGMSSTALAAALLVAVPAVAEELGSRPTREFVQAAAQSDLFEILAATTVLAQSSNPQVRAFATEMINAHQRTRATLDRAVQESGLKPPSPGISNDQSQLLSALQSQRGADLDRVYVTQQILAHHAALATEQGYVASGDDKRVKQAVTASIPVVSMHLQMAEKLAPTVGAGG